MHLQESGEMYLETLLVLSEKQTDVRSVDIGEYMGYSKPSVSRAVGLLKNGGFLTVSSEGFLKLTDSGFQVASRIYERHRMLTHILTCLGVDEKIAAQDACKIEHNISPESFDAIKDYAIKHFDYK